MSRARVAVAKFCEDGSCSKGEILVRGDRVSFVSTEQVRRVGRHKLDADKMPSDVVLPNDFVLVQDPTGELLSPCDVYVVRWHRQQTQKGHTNNSALRKHARDYFGSRTPLQVGFVDIPESPWQRVATVQFIRYRRAGELQGMYEHEYEPRVSLFDSQKPLAWRLPLPEGCVINAHGFVKP